MVFITYGKKIILLFLKVDTLYGRFSFASTEAAVSTKWRALVEFISHLLGIQTGLQ